MTAGTADDDDRLPPPSVRMALLQHVEIPAAGREVKRLHREWLAAIAWKDGLCDELRDIAQQQLAEEASADA